MTFVRPLRCALLLACLHGLTSFALSSSQARAPTNGTEYVKLSEILIPLPPSATSEEVASAEKEVQDIVNGLHAGVPFETEAREHSKGPRSAQGGDVGYFARGVLAPRIETEVFGLKVGAITNPIRTKQGFTIIKVTDHTDSPPKNNQVNLDILTDTAGVDFGPYLSSVLPKSVRIGTRRCRTALERRCQNMVPLALCFPFVRMEPLRERGSQLPLAIPSWIEQRGRR